MERYTVFTDWKTALFMSVLPKLIYRSDTIPIKILAPSFLKVEIDKLFKKFLSTQNSQQVSQRTAGGLTAPDRQTYYKDIVIKTVQY